MGRPLELAEGIGIRLDKETILLEGIVREFLKTTNSSAPREGIPNWLLLLPILDQTPEPRGMEPPAGILMGKRSFRHPNNFLNPHYRQNRFFLSNRNIFSDHNLSSGPNQVLTHC